MITLQEAIALTDLSMGKIAEIVGFSKTMISMVSSHKYSGYKEKEIEILEKLIELGYLTKDQVGEIEEVRDPSLAWKVNPNKFIITQNTMLLDELAKDLLNPATTLNSSIGVVYGHAGYGKSTAIQHFCATNVRASYTLYIEGYTIQMMVRDIVTQLKGVPNRGLDSNISTLKEISSVYRKLLVIDEADRLPIKNIETLRNINEICNLPILLVGEHNLAKKMTSLPRLESRIRSKPIIFQPLSLNDISNFYLQACNIDISKDVKIQKRILEICHGDFRIMVNDAHQILGIMNANNLSNITLEVIRGINTKRKS